MTEERAWPCAPQPPIVPSHSHINPVHTIQPIYQYYFNITPHLRLCLKGRLFPSHIPTETLFVFLFCPTSSCPSHIIIPYLITRIIFGGGYKYETIIRHFIRLFVTSSALSPNIFLSTLLSKTHNLCYKNKSCMPQQNNTKTPDLIFIVLDNKRTLLPIRTS